MSSQTGTHENIKVSEDSLNQTISTSHPSKGIHKPTKSMHKLTSNKSGVNIKSTASLKTQDIKHANKDFGRKGNISVVCRVRPLIAYELKSNEYNIYIYIYSSTCIEVNPEGKIIIKNPDPKKEKDIRTFALDDALGPESTQEEVFERVGIPRVDALFEGYNSTIIAYGPTATGKTHTIQGEIGENNPDLVGLVQRISKQIFSQIGDFAAFNEFTIKVSMIELYMEKIKVFNIYIYISFILIGFILSATRKLGNS